MRSLSGFLLRFHTLFERVSDFVVLNSKILLLMSRPPLVRRVLAVLLRLHCCVRLSVVVVCDARIVAKRCILEQTLLLTA